MKGILNIYLRLMAILLLFSCGDKQPTSPGNVVPTGTEMRVESYKLPAGETQTFPAGFEIISKKGVNIAGTILVAPSRAGDFTVTAESGDIEISGVIQVQPSASESAAKPSRSLAKSGTAGADGASITIRANAGNLAISSLGTWAAGDGEEVNQTIVVGATSDPFVAGNNGGNGGYVILMAPQGEVRLPTGRGPNAKPIFKVGSGGGGGDVIVDRMRFDTELDEVRFVGGRGGRSGQIIVVSQKLTGAVLLIDLLAKQESELFEGGFGGDGGSALWDNSADGVIEGATARLETTYPLRIISLAGGAGGLGISGGGYGGDAGYWANRVINDVGDAVAAVALKPGDGGHVLPAVVKSDGSAHQLQFALHWVKAGDAGVAMGFGNNGWDGGYGDDGQLYRHGADGGDVTVLPANGGSVLKNVAAIKADAGDGNNGTFAQTEIITRYKIRGSASYLDFPFGVVAGFGGDGWDGCGNSAPGGNGGAAGAISLSTGNGGNVETDIPDASRAGSGGNGWTISLGFPGKGGKGLPAGRGGCLVEPELLFGAGGSNGTLQGSEGALLGADLNHDRCDDDGAACTNSCKAVGAVATHYYKSTVPVVDSRNVVTGELQWGDEIFIYNLTARVVERNQPSNSVSRFEYVHSTEHTYKSGFEIVDNGTTLVYLDTTVHLDTTYIGASHQLYFPGYIGNYIYGLLRTPSCDNNGNLQWPGDGMFQMTWESPISGNRPIRTEEWQLTGCANFNMENDEIDRSGIKCCPSSHPTFLYAVCNSN